MDPQNEIQGRKSVKTGARVALVISLLYTISQLTAVYQTRSQLITPVIPESTIWAINKQFIFHAFISAVISLSGLILYFFRKYLLVIILVALMLIAQRYITIHPGI